MAFLPFGMMGLGMGANLVGSLMSKPKRPNFDTDAIMRAIEAYIGKDTERLASAAGTSAAQRAAGQGLTGGAFTQAVNEAEAPVYGQGASQIAKTRAELEMQKQLGIQEYNQRHSDWKGQLWGNLGGGLAGIGGQMAAGDWIKKLMGLYGQGGGGGGGGESGLYGGGGGVNYYLPSGAV